MTKFQTLAITPYLWFNDQAEDAARFYCSVFPNSKITEVTYDASGSVSQGSKPLVVTFRLAGQDFIALNGGPQFAFTEAISFHISCDTQAEVDELWSKLSAGGEESNCGWLKDRYGLSWQVIPRALGEAIGDKDPKKAKKAIDAMLKMRKIDIATLEEARR